MIHELHELLNRAGARVRSLRLWTSLAVCWVFWAGVAYAFARFGGDARWNWTTVCVALAAATLATAVVCWRTASRTGRDPRGIARRIEATHPELGAMLLAALEQAPIPRFKRLGYLQATVVRGAVAHGRAHDWADVTSRGRLRLAKAAHAAALAALIATGLLLVDRTIAHGRASARPSAGDEPLIGAPYKVDVQPGNAEIERGTTLLVIAKFDGPVPPDANLIVRQDGPADQSADLNSTEGNSGDVAASAAAPKARPMTRSLDDPQFVGRVPAVAHDLTYRVEFGAQRSASYRITVFDYPDLVRADAHLEYPAYARLEPKVIEDIRQVTAVEGSQLTLRFRLNKEVATATLVDRDGEETALARAADQEADVEQPVYEISYKLARSQRFKLHLVDRQDRKNKLPPEFVVNVTPNRPPTIKIDRPARDVRVSPVEELEVAAELNDDFGLAAYGLGYSLGGDEPQDVALSPSSPESAAAGDDERAKAQKLSHLIDFESLQAEPDQLVSYYLWAEDTGPDGQPRRTLSDMYFAEVRHFDDIFRQGQQPTEQQMREQQQRQQGQQQGAGQQAEELAELQKQIVNATWAMLRRETASEPSAEFEADATAVQEAQQQAIDQLAELGAEVADAESQLFLEQAQQHMESALDKLTKAAADNSLDSLRSALSPEQTAYQSLLKLRAREFDVSRSNRSQSQQGGASGANSASQQQLQQLELNDDENRYETRSRAQAARQENAQQLDESRQVLNRLRELARRQQDLNERLRELQSALQAAESDQQREELERQLKRLRDQEQEILRDAESLNNDLQNSENRQQMQEASEQLEQTRNRVQQASEALEQGQVSQALTEGARAERELNQLRDEFRRRTADRFTEEMEQLRDSARQLDERQQQLSQQLTQMNEQGARSLRDTGPREELTQGLREQQRQLGETLQQMRDTVTEAEEPEPLLAQELYDAVQNTTNQRTEEALDVSRQLIEAGVNSEAGEAMRQADRGVRELRERVERAAESVLGDETEALRRAADQLQELGEELNREIASAQGRDPDAQPGEQSQQQNAGQPSPGGQPGQQSPSDEDQQAGNQQGQNQQGQNQPGQQSNSPGEQPGAAQPGQENQQGEAQQPQPGEGQQGEGQQGEGQQAEGQQAEGQPGEGQQSEGQPSQSQQGQSASPGGRRGRGGAPDDQPANPGEDQAPGEGQPGQPQNGEQRQPSGDAQQDQQGQPGGQPNDDANNAGARGGGLRDGRRNIQRRGGANLSDGGGLADALSGLDNFFDGVDDREPYRGPITGESFRGWSDGMRQVEDMLGDPELSAEAARIRDRAEQARADYKRRSAMPDWNKLQELVADPLTELRKRITDEIRRKESPDALVPIDRDAAPAEFADEVRVYYQRLGSGE